MNRSSQAGPTHGPSAATRHEDDTYVAAALLTGNAGSTTESWLRRRWRCFRQGHRWHSPLPFGTDFCERCGKLVEY